MTEKKKGNAKAKGGGKGQKKGAGKGAKGGAQTLREAALAKGTGPVRRLDKNETADVRFLFEMDNERGWAYLLRTHDEAKQRSFYHRADADVENGRQRFFATALSVDTGKVEVWELAKSLVQDLIEYEDTYGNVTDRNYRLRRRGERLDTTYTVTPMDGGGPGKKVLDKARAKGRDKLPEALDELLTYVA